MNLSQQEIQRLEALNPDKFYVENVRSLLGVSTWQATQICESAVRRHMFDRRVEVQCPDGAIGAEADTVADLPPVITCLTERDGDYESEDIATGDLKKTTFYRLGDRDLGHGQRRGPRND